jgi:hypothetical protein
MKTALFQLVLQFDCESPEALDAIVEIEEQLISLLGESAEVDGHDIGNKGRQHLHPHVGADGVFQEMPRVSDEQERHRQVQSGVPFSCW